MADIIISKKNNVHLKVQCDDSIAQELSVYFSFEPKNSHFMKKQRKAWDGMLRLYDKRSKTLPYGLLFHLLQFAGARRYSIDIIDKEILQTNPLDENYYQQFVDGLNLHSGGNKIKPYWYQDKIVKHAIQAKRGVYLAATSAGKSLAIYLLCRWYLMKNTAAKILILVPSVGLVNQMYGDFDDYASETPFTAERFVHKVKAGLPKTTSKSITVSTWQSLMAMDEEDRKIALSTYTHFICDEVHGAEGASIQSVSKMLVNCDHRVGLTGTLKNSEAHKLTIEGTFGKAIQIVKAHQLQEGGQASKLNIIVSKLKHAVPIKKDLVAEYQDEVEYLAECSYRTKFICDLASRMKGNILMFYDRRVHGEAMYQYFQDKYPDKEVYLINGDVSGDDRQLIKEHMEENDGIICIASYGTTSTGWSVKRLHHIMFCSGSKSLVRVLQSVGRGLRLHKDKERCMLYDFVDVFVKRESYSYRHCRERIKYYWQEKFWVDFAEFELIPEIGVA